jgi:hypothetical protein
MSSATTCARIKTFKLLRRRGRSRRRFHYYFVAQFEFYRVARLPAAYRYVGSLAEAVFKFRAQCVTALPSKKSTKENYPEKTGCRLAPADSTRLPPTLITLLPVPVSLSANGFLFPFV